MFSPGIEPGTFCVLDRCDNRYTTKTHWHLQIIQPWHAQPGSLLAECARPNITRNPIAVLSRDRLVVRTLRCGRSNPGSNPGHGRACSVMAEACLFFFQHIANFWYHLVCFSILLSFILFFRKSYKIFKHSMLEFIPRYRFPHQISFWPLWIFWPMAWTI